MIRPPERNINRANLHEIELSLDQTDDSLDESTLKGNVKPARPIEEKPVFPNEPPKTVTDWPPEEAMSNTELKETIDTELNDHA